MSATHGRFEVAAPDEVVEPGDLIHRLLEPNGEATAEGVAEGHGIPLGTGLRCGDMRIFLKNLSSINQAMACAMSQGI